MPKEQALQTLDSHGTMVTGEEVNTEERIYMEDDEQESLDSETPDGLYLFIVECIDGDTIRQYVLAAESVKHVVYSMSLMEDVGLSEQKEIRIRRFTINTAVRTR